MKSKNTIRTILKSLLIGLMLGIITNAGFGETIGVFYDLTTPQHEFAAGDIKTALEAKGFSVKLIDLSTLSSNYTGKKVVIALETNSQVTSLLSALGGNVATGLGEQAYALRTTTAPAKSYWILGGDINGAMYGGLQIAENINFNGFSGSYNEEKSPYLKNRGIKFNIPLDDKAPTYFWGNHGTSHKLAIRDVWDINFWKTWFDEMARQRVNVLSLWSPHPFTSMLNMEDEYPGIAIQGVTGFDENGNKIQINDMTIDDKIAFWQKVMSYGRSRGFSIYFYTWNIFLSTAEGKHGLTDSPDNQKTRLYIRKCTKKFFETYPNLKGLGITVGERMGSLTKKQKEEWSWDSYGKGLMEYAQENTDRDIVFVHRQHQGDLTDILDYFKPLTELSNVRFDLSYKYSKAHAHATTTPDYWDRENMEKGLNQYNLKSWLEIRNDDWYFLLWADPQFVRDYVKNFPEVGKYVNGVSIGSDGWVFTNVFTNKEPYYEDRDMLSIQRTWYMQKLWGRISYNPNISDDYFKKCLAFKYPEVSSDTLFQAWSRASRAVQLANEQVTGTWDLDFKWWPEGWTSNNGFRTLEQTRKVVPMYGSNLCSFEQTAQGKCGTKVSAFTISNEIEQLANKALANLEGLHASSNKELELTLKNLKAMAYLGLYNANKFRAAIYLEQDKKGEALDAIVTAYCYWKNYTNRMDELFVGVDLQRNLDFTNWHVHDKDVLDDYLKLGGKGEPNCSDKN